MSPHCCSIKVTADDYGMHPDINRGIRHCIEEGLIDRVSVAACGSACGKEELELLKRLLKKYPKVSAGLHCMLTEGNALTGVSSLTNRYGAFSRHIRGFLPQVILRRVRSEDVLKEWRAQADRVSSAGIELTHLDSHQHVHLLPGIWNTAHQLMDQVQIYSIRSGYQSVMGALKRGRPELVMFQLIAARRFRTTPNLHRTLGVLCSTQFEFSKIRPQLERAIARGEPIEIMTHPGFASSELLHQFGYWNATWENEIPELAKLARRRKERSDTP